MASKIKIAVIGMGLFGKAVVRKLAEEDIEVIVIDKREKNLEDIKDIVSAAYVFDATDINALKEIRIDAYDAVIITIGEDFDALLLSAFMCKELGVKRIIARANNDTQKKILKMIGIENVIIPEEEIGEQIAEMLIHPTVTESIDVSEGIEVIIIRPSNEFIGQKVSLIRKLCFDKDIFFITIRRKQVNGPYYVLPPSKLSDNYAISENDELILLGDKDKIYSILE